MSFLSRLFGAPEVKSSGVSSYLMDGFIPQSWGINWWQRGYDPIPQGTSAIVEACESAYAQTIAMCPGGHWRVKANGGRDRVTNSALSKIVKKPNSYQGISDFLLNLTHSLYRDGNAYAVALRNNRFEIAELHLMNPCLSGARISSTGDIFYALGGNEIVARKFADAGADPKVLETVPARDVLHVRLKCSKDQLKGESPLLSAAIDEAASSAMARQALAFYANQSRPSGVLQSDLVLTKDQVNELRTRWNEQSQGLNAGGVPILTAGLKWQPMAENAQNSQLAEIMGYTDKRIAAVFRVPLPILNLSGQGPQGSTEALMQFWIATGLGFAINHIEDAFGRLFGLSGLPDEYLEFDTSALLRSAFKDRVDAFARGVQGGIFAPNEARAEFEYSAAKFGDEPRVQQQVVPLSFGAQQKPTPPTKPVVPLLPAPSPPAAGKGDDFNVDRDWTRLIAEAADRHESSLHS